MKALIHTAPKSPALVTASPSHVSVVRAAHFTSCGDTASHSLPGSGRRAPHFPTATLELVCISCVENNGYDRKLLITHTGLKTKTHSGDEGLFYQASLSHEQPREPLCPPKSHSYKTISKWSWHALSLRDRSGHLYRL